MNKKVFFALITIASLTACTKLSPSSDIKSIDSSSIKSSEIQRSEVSELISSSKNEHSSFNSSSKDGQSSYYSSSKSSSVSAISSSKNSSKESSSSKSSSKQSSSSYDYSSISSSSYYSSSIGEELWDKSQDYLRSGVKYLDFYNLNDFHGSVEYSDDNQEPGIVRISKYLKDIRDSDPDKYIFTSTGDMWQGSHDSNKNHGELVTKWMNELDCSAMAIGNHDFDWGVNRIISNSEISNFAFLACNIIEKSSGNPVEWAKPYTTITKNGVHIGFVGSIEIGLESSILTSNVKDYSFANPESYAISWANYLRNNGADILVYLTHGSAYNITDNIANAFDFGFCGHSHSEERRLISQKPFVQAYCNGKDAGKISTIYNFGTSTVSINSYIISDLRYLSSTDNETQNLYNHYLIDLGYANSKSQVVAYLSKNYSKYSDSYDEDCSPMLACKSMYLYFKNYLDTNDEYYISCVTHNNARAILYAGQLTYGDLFKAFPFENNIVLCKVKGRYMSYFPSSGDCGIYPNEKQSYDYSTYYYVVSIDYLVEKYMTYLEDRASDAIKIVKRYDGVYPRDAMKIYLSSLV